MANHNGTSPPRDYLAETLAALELAKNKVAAAERELANYRAANPRQTSSALFLELERARALAHREFNEVLGRWSKAKGPTGSRPKDSPNITVNSFNRDLGALRREDDL